MIQLALDGELWQRLCDEVEVGSDLPLSLQETREFPFARALLNETLRRFTPAWFVPRGVCADDLVLCGYSIPKGTMLGLSPLATHHLSELWPDPFRFDVDRWTPGTIPAPNVFLPFGGGPHTCLGAAFATLEMTQALVALAAARQRPLMEKQDDLRPVLLGLPHPSRKILLRFVSAR
jgi:cytochrome P450